MKKRIDVIAGEIAYKNLSTFTELEDLNKTVRAYRDVISTSIKRVDVQARLITLLELLKRHSCKQIGVSYMCKNTIADKLEVSYKTVQRLMKKLEDLGMIRQIAMKRNTNMRQTANAIQIQPINKEMSDKTPTKKDDKCPTKYKTTTTLKQKIKNIRKVEVSAISENSNNQQESNTIEFYDYTYVSSNIPNVFIDSVRPFFNDASEIYRLWSRLKLAAKKSKVNTLDHVDGFIKSFKEAVLNYKQNKVRKDIVGYIYGAWRNTASELARKQNGIYNWLEN
ncbi:helix-turn-helix domain-containing protein [Bacillus sp. JJ722]|uniref:helix-turn-helix domain-containing protein n=1 Tax=Bacillus sp. JJ722 TaxID=3122973 RepID=UPI002FFD9883